MKAAGSLLERENQEAVLVPEYRGEKIREYLMSHPEFERVAILFSGDVGFYSGARGIRELFPEDQVEYICGISSVVYFASRIPTSWQDAKLYSIHGKAGNVIGQIQRWPKVFLLVSGPEDVERVCRELEDFQMDVRVTVGSNLAYPQEQIRRGNPGDFLPCKTRGLHIMLLENTNVRKCWMPGLPDEAFHRGRVPMTKEEIRILSVSKLKLEPDSVVYDVGAGTGSVSVECALLCPEGQVYAIERNPEGIQLIEENAKLHRTANLTAVQGTAPEALAGLPSPTHAFIGGSSGNLKEILSCLREKNPEIRIVMNMITLESVGEAVTLLKGNGDSGRGNLPGQRFQSQKSRTVPSDDGAESCVCDCLRRQEGKERGKRMRLPRLMLAAPGSGSGKTMITCGLLKAFMERGLCPAAFKCGPDFIDPMFHRKIIGAPSRNLDPFFTDESTTRYLFASHAKDKGISVMEGVMGYFDGLGGTRPRASSYDLACVTDTPVILVLNARGMSLSVVPWIQGFADYQKKLGPEKIRGVILNQTTAMPIRC